MAVWLCLLPRAVGWAASASRRIGCGRCFSSSAIPAARGALGPRPPDFSHHSALGVGWESWVLRRCVPLCYCNLACGKNPKERRFIEKQKSVQILTFQGAAHFGFIARSQFVIVCCYATGQLFACCLFLPPPLEGGNQSANLFPAAACAWQTTNRD